MTPSHNHRSTRRGTTFSWMLGLLVIAVMVHVVVLLWTHRKQPPADTLPSAPVDHVESTAPPVDRDGSESLHDSFTELPALPAPNLLSHVPSIRPPVEPILAPLAPQARPLAPEPTTNEPDLGIPSPIAKRLIADAIEARQHGDIGTAIAKLREAEEHVPNHPRLHWEIGTTLETMGLTSKAANSFQRVYDLGGEKAGPYHRLAEVKLTQGMSVIANEAPLDENVYIGNVEERRAPLRAPLNGLDLTLSVTIQARPGEVVNDPAEDVYVVVHLVDTVNGFREELVISDPPEQQWLDLPVDWANGGTETLELRYTLPGIDTPIPGQDASRKKLGYVIELYYKEQLVDLVARPRRLARFSPSLPDAPVDNLTDYAPVDGFTDPADM